MKISAKIDYACRSLLELALRWPNQIPLQVSEIAQRQSIPMKFLIHILISLKQMGLVKSMRGKRGGYVLVKSPAEIRLGDLMMHFSGVSELNPQRSNQSKGHSVMSLVWQEVDEAVSGIMRNINFEDICNRVRATDKNFMYEI